MSRTLSVRLPKELHKKAKAKSKRTGVTLAFVIRTALEKWVATNDNDHSQLRENFRLHL